MSTNGNMTYSIAYAVSDALNTEFVGELVSGVVTIPRFDLDAIGDCLIVRVSPGDVQDTRIGRLDWLETHSITVGVMRKINRDTEDEIMDVVKMADRIKKYLRDLYLSDIAITHPVEISHAPIVSREHYTSSRVALSVIKVTYQK